MENYGSIIAGLNANLLHSNMRAGDTSSSLRGLDLDFALGTASGELSSINSSEPGSPNTPFARGGALSWPEDNAVSHISFVITHFSIKKPFLAAARCPRCPDGGDKEALHSNSQSTRSCQKPHTRIRSRQRAAQCNSGIYGVSGTLIG